MADAPSSSGPPGPRMDEKWKLTKKGSMNATLTGTTSTDSSGGEASSSSGPSFLRRSDSTPAGRGGSFSRKCAAVVKEKRARFYIVRRCVTMLACWKDFREN